VQNGRNYACGRDRHGAIFCWGSLGAVPQGTDVVMRAPLGEDLNHMGVVVRLDNSDQAVSLDLAMFQGCAAYKSDSVSCWEFMRPPREIAKVQGVAEIAVNDDGLGCLLLQDGRLRCWNKDPGTLREVFLVAD
ncbi:MAG: hypothetical protein K2Y51_06390, partial [Gammaproteobacteria bacterium]|nr:hypothetical protein [Gammaproteobacteria bacterium]